ncbi:MAG: tRNA lysidine(34) synthetase TilS [Gammaproteobacteria bacterium]|nr:tRNA lysidine(34) synthetase TilS [Gammaproteobacteria bacterium]
MSIADIQQALRQSIPDRASLCVALSGGRDSSVLLHALAGMRAEAGWQLRAVHVNHGLQPAAGDWVRHCEEFCATLGVPLAVRRVRPQTDGGSGIEAAAREARYEAFAAELGPGEWLLLAHHEDDQLETVLLHLLRGSGVTGLAGIPAGSDFAGGRLCRPLLGVSGASIAAYARLHALGWIEDPSNADVALDRNFLRARVIPPLRMRWPAAARAAGRSARLAAEAAELLADLARVDAQAVMQGETLNLEPFRGLGETRQRNLLRHLVRQRGWPMPPEQRLAAGLRQLLDARPDRHPVLAWSGHSIRRFRERLYLVEADPGVHPDGSRSWNGEGSLQLGALRGELRLQPATGAGLARQVVDGGLQLAFRNGGEAMRSGGDAHHRSLKYLYQKHAVVPWMRSHIPLLYAGRELAAVADLWLADWAMARPGEPGALVSWTGHAAIH